MPQIKIREVDTTTVGASATVTNTVYIPGYANIGPLNEPTLCETLSDFQRIFGSQPYRYSQNWPYTALGYDDTSGKTFVREGDYERSYLMAAGLLNLGMPVIFERCYKFNEAVGAPSVANQIQSLSYAYSNNDIEGFNLVAANPGEAGAGIVANITATTIGQKNQNPYYILYTLTASYAGNSALGIPEVTAESTSFVLNTADEQGIPENIKTLEQLNGSIDSSGLLIFNITANTENPAISITIPDNSSLSLTGTVGQSMEFNLTDFYSILANRFNSGLPAGQNPLMDRGEYVFKFLTAGGYPTFGPMPVDAQTNIASNPLTYSMAQMAAARGDLIAITDYAELYGDAANMKLYDAVTALCSTSLVDAIGGDAWSYAAMFAPYAVYYSNILEDNVILPASYGYLSSLASSIQNNPDWLAVAGVTRGTVPNLISLNEKMPAAIADAYQPRNGVSINAITDVKPYGLRIWGNRTLKDNGVATDLVATSFLNIRHLANDVKRAVYVTSKRCTFEQNNDILWVNYKAQITPLLDQMVTGGGLSGYRMTRQTTDKRATLKAKITLYAIEAVEDFDITIELADGVTAISE